MQVWLGKRKRKKKGKKKDDIRRGQFALPDRAFMLASERWRNLCNETLIVSSLARLPCPAACSITSFACPDRVRATSSRATSESACSFHNDGEFSARLSSSNSVLTRATTATVRSSTRA